MSKRISNALENYQLSARRAVLAGSTPASSLPPQLLNIVSGSKFHSGQTGKVLCLLAVFSVAVTPGTTCPGDAKQPTHLPQRGSEDWPT